MPDLPPLRIVLPVALLALVAAAPASASRPANPNETRLISAALNGIGCDFYEPGACEYRFRVSTKNQRWAAARIVARPHHPEVQEDIASLYHGKARWRVHQAGNGGGCDVPKAVRKDLHLVCY